jgi:cell pole-organizing protein PopZ
MSGAAPEQEPSIEEILASIRQIISDDDEQAPPAVSAEPEPIPELEPAPPPPPPPPPALKEDVLELKDPLPPPQAPVVIDMEDAAEEEPMVVSIPTPEFKPEPAAAPKPAATAPDASILTDAARAAALTGFSKLTGTMNMDRGTTPHASSGGSSLEDIVRDMLTPMLRTWLDENLPPIIEKLVQKELDKLARKAMDD